MTKRSRGSRTAQKSTKPIIGWKEWVSFPELGVAGIRSKVDTGARTSALHATNLREFEVDGAPWVRFAVHCEHESTDEEVTVELPLVERRPVRDSSGREEVRPVVTASVELGGQKWQIEVTLTRRDDMEFNMLLGRRAVRERFVIDPERVYVLGVPGALETPKKKSPTGKMARSRASRKTSARRPGTKKTGRKKKTPRTKLPRKKAPTKKPIRKKASKKKPSRTKAPTKKPTRKKASKKKPTKKTSTRKGSRS